MKELESKIKERITCMLPILNEKQRRLYLGIESKAYGYGGVSCISRLSKTSRPTIIQGVKDLNNNNMSFLKTRNSGGGRNAIYRKHPSILKELEKLIEPLTIGDPMSPLRWTVKSTRNLAE